MDYEELRNKNIAERRALFSDLFQELGEKATDLKNEIGVTRGTTGYLNGKDSENGASKKKRYTQKSTLHPELKKEYETRSRACKKLAVAVEDGDDDDSYSTRDVESREMYEDKDENRKRMRKRLEVIFPFAKSFTHELEEEILDDWERDEDIIRTSGKKL